MCHLAELAEHLYGIGIIQKDSIFMNITTLGHNAARMKWSKNQQLHKSPLNWPKTKRVEAMRCLCNSYEVCMRE